MDTIGVEPDVTRARGRGATTIFPHGGVRALRAGLVIGLGVLLCACATGSATSTDVVQMQQSAQRRAETEQLNRQLAMMANASSARTGATGYRVGPGDVLDIAVFQVEELNRKVRVSGSGTIDLPLLDELEVEGKTALEIERLLADRLEEKYLHDPQVSVFIDEYRSQEITVMGAVENPGIHNVRRPHSLLEVLSMSGGLLPEAGTRVYVQTRTEDPDSGRMTPSNVVVDLQQLLESGNPEYNLVLRGGDSVHVPKAGTVFVEGAVNKPGAYTMKGETNVLKAVAMAGGTKWEAKEASIRVFRQAADGQKVLDVDLESVKSQSAPDLLLKDGDIVVVDTSTVKSTWAGFWRGFTGIFGVGYGL